MTATATATSQSAGQILAATLRQSFRIGTRTGRYGKVFGTRTDLHNEMVEAIEHAVQLPGYYGPERTEILRTAWGAAMSYRKHVNGYRIDGQLAFHINGLSAYQFAALLGRTVDAGVTTTGDGEAFFAAMARETKAWGVPMDLIFTSDGSATRGCTDAGLELFSIHPSTTRGQEYVTLSARLPGMSSNTMIDAPEGTSKYGHEVHVAAIETAQSMLENWLRSQLGIDTPVNVIREY